ncbi:GGDEF domain-containing protein [Lactococcus piscium]|uniref:Diguanylate cyclase n=1 Tax=Pseudolactococcus paracarnosus TaxID=2749962 RepID=A0A7L4WDW7_9LACT|nr:GGDEF domain-containing protein [Lactococcus paracarnosus]MCJ1994915.1 GGDEF domain-containing protein [Lactococcus paracarnosus]QDJ28466.1 diguanylate cyclase [Lactococcus paracarnosus]SPC35074.1 Diguanylate cyclase with GAF sensor domain [Lactococcus piscium]
MFISILANMSILLVSLYGYLSYYANYGKFHSFFKANETVINSVFVTIVGTLLLYFAIVIDGARYDLRFLLLAFTVKYFGSKVGVISATSLMFVRLLWGGDHHIFIAITYSLMLVIMLPLLKIYVGKIKSDVMQLLILNYCCLAIGNFLNVIIFHNLLIDIQIYGFLYVISTIMIFIFYFMINDIRRMQKQSSHDYLTKMKNRSEFQNKIDMLVKKEKVFSLAILDIDYFKMFNDSFNHLVGDLVLLEVGKVFLSFETHQINCYRIGGEEFAFTFEQTEFRDVEKELEKIRQTVQKININTLLSNEEIKEVTVSIGATHVSTFSNVDNFMLRADEALYKAKESGRNRVVVSV